MFNDGKYLILMHGIPGSGKSTFVANNFKDVDTKIICPDSLREEYKSMKTEWGDKFEYRIWKLVDKLVKISLKNNRVTVIDATFISRKDILKQFKSMQEIDSNIKFRIIDFSDMELENCIANNLKRKNEGGRFVPEDVIKNMYQRIKRTKLLEFEPMTIPYKEIK